MVQCHIPEEQKKMEFVVTSRILWYFYKHQFKLIMNEWSYTSANPICLHGMDKENFTLCILMHNAFHMGSPTFWRRGFW
jgi:hypothetical protein